MSELFREQFWLRMTSGSSGGTLDSIVLVRWYKSYYTSTGLPVPGTGTYTVVRTENFWYKYLKELSRLFLECDVFSNIMIR